MFDKIQNEHFNSFVKFAYYTGARSGEISNIKIPNKVKSFHFHLSSGVDENRSEVLKSLNNDIKKVAEQRMQSDHPDLNSYYKKMTSPKKVAFIHFGKCGGVYTNHYMRKLFSTYDMFMSWHSDLNTREIKDRDWT